MTEPPTPPPTPPPPPPDDDDAFVAGLDERARRLIDDARADVARVHAEAAARRHRERELEEQLAALQREHESDQERVVREAKEAGRAEAKAEHDQQVAGYERRLVASTVAARAAGRFADPADAVLYVTLDEIVAEPDARKRDELIDAQLAGVLERKPHLAVNGTRPPSLVTPGGRGQTPAGRPSDRAWLRGK